MSWEDPIVAEVRRIRGDHAASYDYDLDRIFEALKAEERASGRTFVVRPSRLGQEEANGRVHDGCS